MSDPQLTHRSGVLAIDKPPGITSAAAVARVKRLLPRKTKVGHAGTLDRFASGVLLVLIRGATRLCESMMDQPKGYRATLKLGATTDSLDPDTPESLSPIDQPPGRSRVESALAGFRGMILQKPPLFSAVKIAGRRASDRARAGRPIEPHPRTVRVDRIEIVDYSLPLLTLDIECGRGFYVRALARDLGEALGTAAYLTALCRTFVGPYTLADAIALDRLDPATLAGRLDRSSPRQRSAGGLPQG